MNVTTKIGLAYTYYRRRQWEKNSHSVQFLAANLFVLGLK